MVCAKDQHFGVWTDNSVFHHAASDDKVIQFIIQANPTGLQTSTGQSPQLDSLVLRNDVVGTCIRIVVKILLGDVHGVIADTVIDSVEDISALVVRVHCEGLPGFLVAASIIEVQAEGIASDCDRPT